MSQDNIQKSAIQQFYEAFVKVQGDLPLIEKNKQGNGYQYADIGQLLLNIREVLFVNDMTISHEEIVSAELGTYLKSYLTHKSGYSIQTCAPIIYNSDVHHTTVSSQGKTVRNNVSQSHGTALTYARRYNIYNLLNLGFGLEPADEDKDGVEPKDMPLSKPVVNEPVIQLATSDQIQTLVDLLELTPSYKKSVQNFLDSHEHYKTLDLLPSKSIDTFIKNAENRIKKEGGL